MSLHRWDHEEVHIYWDYDTTRTSSASSALSTYDIVKNIRAAIKPYGPIKSFKAYSDFSAFSLPRTTNPRSELSSSGVTLVDCPGDGRKDLSTKILLVDLILNAWDNPPPRTFVIITGDRDLAYAVSILRTRDFRVVVICPSTTHVDLTVQASSQLDWSRVVLGITGELPNITLPQLPLKEMSASSFNPRRQTSEATNDAKSVPNSRESTLERSEPQALKASNPEPRKSIIENVLTRGRRNSLFSAYDPRKFDFFDDFDPHLATPTAGIGSFGLGDGPLFSRPRSQGDEQSRADSAPPNIQYSTDASTPRILAPSSLPFTDIERGTGTPSLTLKGKQKEQEIEETKVEHILPQAPQEIVLLPQAPQEIVLHPQVPQETVLPTQAPQEIVLHPQVPQEIVLIPLEPPLEDRQIRDPPGESPTDIMYSDSIFEPFGGSAPFDVPEYYTSDEESHSTQSTSPSSAGSPFSKTTRFEETSTAPTSAEVQSLTDKSDNTIKPLVVVKDSQPKGNNGTTQPLHTPRQNSQSSIFDGKQACAKCDVPIKPDTKGIVPKVKGSAQVPPAKPSVATTPVKLPPSIDKPPQASSSKAPPPASKNQSNGVAKPKESCPAATVPSAFVTLQQVLREQKSSHLNGVPKSMLGAILPKKNPAVYKVASCSKFSQYIAAAVTAGVVVEKLDTRGEPLVALSSLYA